MNKLFASALILFLLPALTIQAQTEKNVKKVLELKVSREGGANGACVAWHPGLKRYYASMAGNISFFLGVYDVTGKRLSPVEQETHFDVRGLWYNPTTKTLQMNGYNDFGWGEYILDTKGFPTDVKVLHEDMNQPNEQSVGAFNMKERVVYFFNAEGNIEVYEDGVFQDNIDLKLGKTSEDDDDDFENDDVLENYNSTTAIYTGIPGAEIGLLNHLNRQVELYSLKDGQLTRLIKLPTDAPVPEYLNFAFCNGVYWLFDTKARIWIGYK